jgi:hypothetical protein
MFEPEHRQDIEEYIEDHRHRVSDLDIATGIKSLLDHDVITDIEIPHHGEFATDRNTLADEGICIADEVAINFTEVADPEITLCDYIPIQGTGLCYEDIIPDIP